MHSIYVLSVQLYVYRKTSPYLSSILGEPKVNPQNNIGVKVPQEKAEGYLLDYSELK